MIEVEVDVEVGDYLTKELKEIDELFEFAEEYIKWHDEEEIEKMQEVIDYELERIIRCI